MALNRFITDYEDAILAQILSVCGAGGTYDDDPEYLELVTSRRGMIVPDFLVDRDEMPAFIMQYLYLEEDPGTQPQMRAENILHHWKCGLFLTVDLDTMNLSSYATEDEFYNEMMAAATTLLYRVREELIRYRPGTQDDTFRETAGPPDVGISQFWPRRVGDFEYEVIWLIDYQVFSLLRGVL